MAHEPFPNYPSLADAIEDAEKVTVRWGHDSVRHLSSGQVAAIVAALRTASELPRWTVVPKEDFGGILRGTQTLSEKTREVYLWKDDGTLLRLDLPPLPGERDRI